MALRDLPPARPIASAPLPPPMGAAAAPQFRATSPAPGPSPASAYQPPRYNGAAVVSGRGLY
jgi:hypothetical protein